MAESVWRKSSRSGSATKCVEVAFDEGAAWVRDSKNRDGARFVVSAHGWRHFLQALRSGRFDAR